MKQPFPLVIFWLVAGSLPVVVRAEVTAVQEFQAAMQSTPNPEAGAQIYRTCATCHGPLGGGKTDGSVPRIGGQHYSVLVKQLTDYRHDRRWDPRMERITDGHHLGDTQAVADVAEFVNQLGILTIPGVGQGDELKRGKEVYARSCSSCHGASAEGDAKRGVPQLAGQHYEYLQRQIHDAVEGRRSNLPPGHIKRLSQLDRDDIQGVADFLARQKRHYDPPLQVAGR